MVCCLGNICHSHKGSFYASQEVDGSDVQDEVVLKQRIIVVS